MFFVMHSTNHTISIHTSTQGSQGSKISIHQAALLAALTMETGDLTRSNGTDAAFSAKTVITAGNQAVATNIISFAAEDSANTWNLGCCIHGFFPAGIGKYIIFKSSSRWRDVEAKFCRRFLSVQQTNIRAALGRIEDVDIAEESANLSKYSILTQAAASMVAQANSTNDVALMLLR